MNDICIDNFSVADVCTGHGRTAVKKMWIVHTILYWQTLVQQVNAQVCNNGINKTSAYQIGASDIHTILYW